MPNDLATQAPVFQSETPKAHDPVFLEILQKHGFEDRPIRIPLKARYTKPRRWSDEELEWAYEQWKQGATFNDITATLNRNPQDIIFKLINLCQERGEVFTEAGRNVGSANWDSSVEACASELFAEGLPAWKIALIFEVNFEHCEKKLYAGRPDYGHNKKNPFAICTEHKRDLNKSLVEAVFPNARSVFEGYAGTGESTKGYLEALPNASLLAVERDDEAALALEESVRGSDRVIVERDTARRVLLRRILDKPTERFDLIDLDPFVSCADSIGPALEMARDTALLFVTFGGEYRRCFIGSNRKSLAKRYRAQLSDLSNAEALDEMPRFMLGELASQAMSHGFVVEPLLVVRYPMVVRAYLKLRKPKRIQELLDRFNEQVHRDARGARFDVPIPKWKSIDASAPLGQQTANRPHVPRLRR